MVKKDKILIQHKPLFIIIIFFCLLCGCTAKKYTEHTTEYHGAEFWPIFRGDQNLSGVAAVQLPDNMNLLWSFTTGAAIISSPVIGYGNVYVGSTDGKVYAIGLRNGKKIWEFDTDDDIEASPLLLDHTLYIGNLNGNFFSLDAQTGRIGWTYKISGDIMGSANWVAVPGSAKKLVLVGSYDKAGTGRQLRYENVLF